MLADVTVKEVHRTLGKHDVVALLEASDNETKTAWALNVGTAGKVRTQRIGKSIWLISRVPPLEAACRRFWAS